MKKLLLAFGMVALLAGCAAQGVKYSAMEASTPQLRPDQGRVYFYRNAAFGGAAIRPEISLNGQVVGQSMPGGFFYIDQPAGSYEASAKTEVTRKLSFSLEKGETKYVRTAISIGIMVGRINFELIDPAQAKGELLDLSFTGDQKN